ncbi:aminopeptidase [Thioflexithrix psekupsensis]|nr:aminopeptidase [Thioflexithrix psekupsensis]
MVSLLTGLLNGCSGVHYYSQAVGGQWDIWQRTQAISHLLLDESIDDTLKQRFNDILAMRAFASRELHLPDNDSYRHYADLQRPYVVWSVFATPEFSLTPKQWCFWFVGCVTYRGYFSQTEAETFADSLSAEGNDVYVAGIAAYSTLGWFADPVLNTMLHWSDWRLAGLIFHELAHQQLYIANDTAFNEAFAMTVEYEGIKRWLLFRRDEAQWQEYQRWLNYQHDFNQLILDFRQELDALYQESLEPSLMAFAKQNKFAQLQQRYQELKTQRWDNFSGYDRWFNEVNNAKLNSVMTYQQYVPALQTLLAQQEGDLLAFYQAAAQLGALSFAQRQAYLAQLSE